jgi:hypothetical protein
MMYPDVAELSEHDQDGSEPRNTLCGGSLFHSDLQRQASTTT